MSLKKKKKQLLAAALAALMSVSAGVPAVIASAPVALAIGAAEDTTTPDDFEAIIDGFKTVTNSDGTLTITGIADPDKVIEIKNSFACLNFPATLGGKKVKKLGSFLFKDLHDVEHEEILVSIENGIEEVAAFAFRDNTLDESRSKLAETLSIPASVTKFDVNATDMCPKLRAFVVDAKNPNYKHDFNGLLLNKDGTELICYPSGRNEKTCYLLQGVKKIGERAFFESETLEEIDFSNCDTLLTIDSQAFMRCTGLKDIALPRNLKTVNSSAFQDCSSLEAIFVPYTVTTFQMSSLRGTPEGCKIYYEGTKEDWEQKVRKTDDLATGETIERQVITPEDDEYADRPGYDGADNDGFDPTTDTITVRFEQLVPPEVDNSSTFALLGASSNIYFELGENTFKECGKNLTTINLPKNVSRIEPGIFANCPKLKTIYYAGTEDEWNQITFEKDVDAEDTGEEVTIRNRPSDLVVPEGVEVVYESDFAYELNRDGTLTNLGYLCPNEEIPANVTIPDEVDGKKVTVIDGFAGCPIETVEIPEGITSIRDNAFASTRLTQVKLPSTVNEMGTGVFEGCTALKDVDLSEIKMNAISDGTFRYCQSLTHISFPDGLRAIGEEAFQYCTSIESFYFPADLFRIGDFAFDNCTSLVDVGFFPCPDTEEKYIGAYAFNGCAQLSSIALPQGLATIEEGVFMDCDELRHVWIPSSVESIQGYAFHRASGNEDITYYYQGTEAGWELIAGTENLIARDEYGNLSVYWIYGILEEDVSAGRNSITLKNINPNLTYIILRNEKDGTIVDSQRVPADVQSNPNATVTFSNLSSGTTYLVLADSGIFCEEFGTVAVTTQRKKSSSSSSSKKPSSSSGSSAAPSTSQPTAPTTPSVQTKPDQPVTGVTSSLSGQSGNALVNDTSVQTAIENAQKAAQSAGTLEQGIAVSVPVATTTNQESLAVTLQSSTLDKLIESQVKSFEITSNQISVKLDANALQHLDTAAPDSNLVLRVTIPKTMPSNAQTVLGQRPVYDVGLYRVSSSGMTRVTNINGTVTIKLPYTLAAGEDASKLYGVYVDDDGNVEWLTQSHYDEDAKAVVCETNHLSIYGIGYDLNQNINLDTSTVRIPQGSSYAFLVKGNNNTTDLKVLSTDPSVADVILDDAFDDRGAKYRINAKAAGSTTIRVIYEGQATSIRVNVEGSNTPAGQSSITVDTSEYVMAPGDQYTIGAVLKDKNGQSLSNEQVQTMLSNGTLKVRDSRTGSIVDLRQLSGGNFQATAKNEGTTYILYEIGGTQTSVRIDVQNGVQPHGTTIRKTSYFAE